MKKLFTVLLTVLMTLCLFGCSGDSTSTDEASQETESKELVIYSPNSEGEYNAIIPAFEEKYGIKVTFEKLGTGDCLTRITAEKENPLADIMWGGLNYQKWATTQEEDLWENYKSPNLKNIIEEGYRETNGYYTNFGLSGNTALLVNKDEIAKLGLTVEDIDGYQSLIDHADVLKGHVASGDPAKSSSAWQELVAMIYYAGGGQNNDFKSLDMDAAWDYVAKFIDVIDHAVIDSSGTVHKATQAGEYAVAVTYEDPAVQWLKDGATNVEVVYPKEANNWTPCAVGIVKNCKNLENAKLFVDFLISEEGQQLYAGTTLRPIITSYTNTDPNMKPLSEIPNIFVQDEAYIAEQTDAWKAKWTELLNK